MSCWDHLFCYCTKKAGIQAFILSIFDLQSLFYSRFMMFYWSGLPQWDYWAELGFAVVDMSIFFYSTHDIFALLYII